jgi:hypothetical protein
MTLSGAGRLKNCLAVILYNQSCWKRIDDIVLFVRRRFFVFDRNL